MSVNALKRLYKSSVTLDHSLSAYSAGDALGGKQTLAVHNIPGRGIFVHEIRVIDPEPQASTNGVKIHMFMSDFTATADNAPWVIASDADAAKYLGNVSNANTDYTDFTTSKWDSIDVSKPLYLSGSNLYFQCAAIEAFDSTAAAVLVVQFVYERL